MASLPGSYRVGGQGRDFRCIATATAISCLLLVVLGAHPAIASELSLDRRSGDPPTTSQSDPWAHFYSDFGYEPWAATLAASLITLEPSTVAHVVAEAETLKIIAAQYGVETTDLIDLNDLTDPDNLAVGQVLQIGPARYSGTARSGARDAVTASISERTVPLAVPYRSQFDGSPYESGNCGPASLGMAMAYFGEIWSTQGIRNSVATYMGDWTYGQGSSWESLAAAAVERGFVVDGLTGGGGRYRTWTLEDLDLETRRGRPVILLVRYWSLPGNQDKEWQGDHYIVFLGFDSDGDAVYHDPAYWGGEGARLYMSKERLVRAWTRTWSGIQYSAMTLNWPGVQ